MITLQKVAVIFGKNTPLETKALDDINLHIAAGDFITVIGGNGAGKSTLLKLLSGELKASSGHLTMAGQDLTPLSPEQRAVDVAYVNQDPRLGTCEAFTLEENLAFALNRGIKRGLRLALNASLRARFRDLLGDLKLGLEKRLGDKVASLSGGQRQALSLVMATLRPCKILLLDEHTAALDPKATQQIHALTARLIKERQLTTLMITHHLSLALEMGNRTLLLRQGKVENDLGAEERSRLQPRDLLCFF